MFKKLKRVICAVAAVAVMAAVSVTAAADYVYQLGDSLCDEIKADFRDITGSEGTFVTTFGDSTEEKYISLRFKLFNEYLDPEFWNSDDVSVSVDVRLDTQGADIIGCIPGFNSKWSWINPSDYTKLKYGEWITVTETGKHFYPEFSKAQPAYVLFQARTNWGASAQGEVTISVRNFRITGGAAEQPAETTTATTTTAVTTTADTTTTAAESTAAPEENSPETAEITAEKTAEITAEATSGATAEAKDTVEASVPEEPAQTTAITTTSAPQTTSIYTLAVDGENETINYNDLYSDPEPPTKMIVIIVGIAVVVSVGAVVGYIIYKKKKFY